MAAKTMAASMTLVAMLSALVVTWAAPSGNVTTENVTTENVTTGNFTAGSVTSIPCEAGNFTAGDNAKLNCIFSQNIEESIHHVYVTKYSFDDEKKFTDVIICIRKRDQQFHCTVEEGYKFNAVLGSNFTFEIPEVTTQFAGRYTCSLVPPDHVPQDSCRLYVQELFPQTTPEGKRQVPVSSNCEKCLPLAFALTAISVLAGVLLLCLVWIKRHSVRNFLCGREGQSDGLEMKAAKDYELVPQSETETAGDDEFKLWKKDLTDETVKRLQEYGYDNIASLLLVTEEDIKAVGLKKGHEKVVLEKVKDLRRAKPKNPTEELVVSMESKGNVKSTKSPSVRPDTLDETMDSLGQEEGVPGSSRGDEEGGHPSPTINSGASQHMSTNERSKTGRETKPPAGTFVAGDTEGAEATTEKAGRDTKTPPAGTFGAGDREGDETTTEKALTPRPRS